MVSSGFAKKINLFCLLAAIVVVLVLPPKKEIWFDETISMLCSKGISNATPDLYANTHVVSSATIAQLNTAGDVFHATVLDNGNSFVFNIGLHWFTMLFGNSLQVYMLFSKLSGIAALIALYALCGLLFGDSIFKSVAVLLFATDGNFLAMSHEIRAYSMGMFFVTAAAVYFYKFMYREEKPVYLLLLGLFSVGAILSHFLTVYIILVFLAGLLLVKRTSLFTVRNVLALLVPLCIVAVFFYCSYLGLQLMNQQNSAIQQRELAHGFSVQEVLTRSMKYTAINFKAVFPSLVNNNAVILLSCLLVTALYIAGVRAAVNKTDKRNLHLLFVLGISSTFFLAFLSVKAHHYTSIYYRYYCFCIPFTSLFMAYVVYVFAGNPRINSIVKGIIATVVILPAASFFVIGIIKGKLQVHYNHMEIAAEIMHDNIGKVEIPEWSDAFILQSLLPQGYKIDYVLNQTSPYFTLYKTTGEEKVPVLKDHL